MGLCEFIAGVERAHSSGEKTRPANMEKSHFITDLSPVHGTQCFPQCSSFARLSVLVCFVGMLVAGESSARASCGDWLAHSDNSMNGIEAGTTSADQSAVALSDKSGTSRRIPLTAPCRGPHCSKSPAGPAQPVPLNVSVSVDKLAVVMHGDSHEPTARHFRSGQETDAHSESGFPARIDHPPRA